MSLATRLLPILAIVAVAGVPACEDTATPDEDHSHAGGDGHSHDGREMGEHDGQNHASEHDGHGELINLGDIALGGMQVRAAQGHGQAEAGKELHLIVTLPQEAANSTVRAWIGTEDRLASTVALADYSEGSGGHELHAIAPDPLPENASWWIEVELPDGTTHVGSVSLQ
ncbi:MAG: hypothetical protein ACIAS6_07145 [Phycisphaerales bacterium JB060]